MKTKRKGYLVAVIFLAIGAGCWTVYNYIGSYVDEEGWLHEPFGLIPIGYFFLFLGIIWGLVTLIRSFFLR
jgi:hypothetical protein